MIEYAIYAAAGLTVACSLRRMLRLRRQAERDLAAIERVRSLKLPAPPTPASQSRS